MSEGQLNKKGLMDLTIKEMKDLGVKMSDIFSLHEATINLSWDQVIRVVNYLAGSIILTEASTAGQALEAMSNFLL